MRISPLLLILPSLALVNCASKPPQPSFMPTEMSSDYRLRHPILVSSSGARIPHKCGVWDEDLGAGGHSFKNNHAHWNHGCATQQNFAAMVANPNDLLHPRAVTESNARRRQEVFDKYQKGQDPTIPWKIEDKNKNANAGGN
jgi:type IV pilus biogenesis protein CpaD/CtpE